VPPPTRGASTTLCALLPACRPKHQAVLAVLVADVDTPVEVVAVRAAVVKMIPSVPTPWAIVGVPMLVEKKAKALKESAPETLEESAVC
jgi:hypothetical protein